MAEHMVPLQGLILFVVILVILLIIFVALGAFLSKKGKKGLGRLIGGLLLFLYGLSLIIGFWSFLGIVGPALSAEEVATQEADGNFLYYDEGDLITVRDNVGRLDAIEIKNKTYFAVWFESSGTDDGDFNVTFEGDIKDSYSKGDLVVVFLQVVRYNTSSDKEILEIHAPKGDPCASKYQIWPSWVADLWFWLILVLGVVWIVLGIIGMKTKKPEEVVTFCPNCGNEPIYIEQYEKFYCFTCKQWIEPVEKSTEEKHEEAAKVCPSCGEEPTYVEQYQRYYCYTCNQYVEPVEKKAEEKPSSQLPPPPPPPIEPQPEQQTQISEEPPPSQHLPPPPPPPPPSSSRQEEKE